MAELQSVNFNSSTATEQVPQPSGDQERNVEKTSCLSPSSDLFKTIIQCQPKVLLTRIKTDDLPRIPCCIPKDNDLLSSSSDDYIERDSDEDWADTGNSQRGSRKFCSSCLSSYARQFDLDKHIRQMHGDRHMPFTCDDCGRGFMRQESMLSHRKKACKTSVRKDDSSEVIPGQAEEHAPVPTATRFTAKKAQKRRLSLGVADSLAIDKIMAGLDFSLPAKYKDDEEVSSTCLRCGMSYPSRSSMIKHYRAAHKDAPMPYSCHNCSLGFLDVRGLKTHLSKSKRFCAKIVYDQTKGKLAQKHATLGTGNTQSLDGLPVFRNEHELLSYLREKSKLHNSHALNGALWCPVCDKMVPSSILVHLQHHKENYLRCKKQNRLLCDVCLVDSDSWEWMIKHQQEAHKKSMNAISLQHDSKVSTENKDSSHSSPTGQSDGLNIMPQLVIKESQKLSKCSPDFKSGTDSFTTLDSGSVFVSSNSESAINMQNVIEIKPVDEELDVGNGQCLTVPNKNVVASINLAADDAKTGGQSTVNECADSHPLPNCGCRDVPVEQSPGPPVLQPPASLFSSMEESSSDMPDLCRESEEVGDCKDVIMVSDSRRSWENRCSIKVKQEKDVDAFSSLPSLTQMMQSLKPRGGGVTSLSERSFMDALLPAREPVSLTQVSGSVGDDHIQSGKSELQWPAVKNSISTDNQMLSTVKERFRVEEGSVKADDGNTHGISNYAYNSVKTSSINRASCHGESKNVSGRFESLAQRWTKDKKQTSDSAESDSGVSEVKLDDDDIQDEVTVIDLDDRSVITEYIASDAGAERSLHPGEHKAMMKQRLEMKNRAMKHSSENPLNREPQTCHPAQLEAVNERDGSSKQQATDDQMKDCRGSSLEEKKKALLAKQKELFDKLEHILSVIPDTSSAASKSSWSSTKKKRDQAEKTTMNGQTCSTIREAHKRKQQHSKLLLSCDKCGKGFQSIGLLTKHRRFAHDGQKSVQGHDTNQWQHAKTTHMQPRNQLKMRAYPCSKCGEYYPSLALLHEHKKVVHHLTSRYLCLECDKSFASRGQLQSHTRWKHKPMKFKPPVAASQLTTKAMLKQVYFPNHQSNPAPHDMGNISVNYHRAVHKPDLEKNPVDIIGYGSMHASDCNCSICGAVFYDRDEMARHEQIYHADPQLVGTQPGMRFTEDASTMRSSKKQDSVRYICDVCGLAYLQTYSLMCHRQKQHPEASSVNINMLRVDVGHVPNTMLP